MASIPPPGSSAPKLFPEILDPIVEKIAQLEDPKGGKLFLAAMALTARRFRRPAHERIFQKIRLTTWHVGAVSEWRIDKDYQLCAMMEANPQSALTGAVSFVRSYEFDLRSSLESEDVVPLVNDGAMANIMRNLFKSTEDVHRGERTYSFGLSVRLWGDACNAGGTMFDWQQLESDFLVAFCAMRQNPGLKRLLGAI